MDDRVGNERDSKSYILFRVTLVKKLWKGMITLILKIGLFEYLIITFKIYRIKQANHLASNSAFNDWLLIELLIKE